MNYAFHRPIDCSETFSIRAASAIDISPAKIANTIRVFFSGGIIGGRPIASRILRGRTPNMITAGTWLGHDQYPDRQLHRKSTPNTRR